MGMKSSKEAEQTLVPGTYNPIIGYKTSIYGWGKLTHPVRKYKVPNTKKKAKLNKKPIADIEQVLPDVIDTKPITITPQKHVATPSKNQSADSTTKLKFIAVKSHPPEPGTEMPHSRSSVKSHFPNSTPSSPTNQILQPVKSHKSLVRKIPTVNKPTSNTTFYGKYRCPKCQKYWVSGLAQAGVPQNCRGCETPTNPMAR